MCLSNLPNAGSYDFRGEEKKGMLACASSWTGRSIDWKELRNEPQQARFSTKHQSVCQVSDISHDHVEVVAQLPNPGWQHQRGPCMIELEEITR